MQRGAVRALREEATAEQGALPGVDAPPENQGAVDHDGFNIHASVAIAADDDLGRERLMRYGARPPLALDRLRRLPGGRIAYRIPEAARRTRQAPDHDPAGISRTALGYRPSASLLLHCVPGSIAEKAVAFDNLRLHLKPGGVIFGSTILSIGVDRNSLASKTMALFNARGIFHNDKDSVAGLSDDDVA
jgi:hypothetical protein